MIIKPTHLISHLASLQNVRKVRPSRKARPRSTNPLRSMATHVELQTEYTQVALGTAEKEFKRIKKEKCKECFYSSYMSRLA